MHSVCIIQPQGESTDPGISELDDVLKQLEDIQSGGLASCETGVLGMGLGDWE